MGSKSPTIESTTRHPTESGAAIDKAQPLITSDNFIYIIVAITAVSIVLILSCLCCCLYFLRREKQRESSDEIIDNMNHHASTTMMVTIKKSSSSNSKHSTTSRSQNNKKYELNSPNLGDVLMNDAAMINRVTSTSTKNQTEGAPPTAFTFDPATKGASSPGSNELNNILHAVLSDKDSSGRIGGSMYERPKNRKMTKKKMSEGPKSLQMNLHMAVPSASVDTDDEKALSNVPGANPQLQSVSSAPAGPGVSGVMDTRMPSLSIHHSHNIMMEHKQDVSGLAVDSKRQPLTVKQLLDPNETPQSDNKTQHVKEFSEMDEDEFEQMFDNNMNKITSGHRNTAHTNDGSSDLEFYS